MCDLSFSELQKRQSDHAYIRFTEELNKINFNDVMSKTRHDLKKALNTTQNLLADNS